MVERSGEHEALGQPQDTSALPAPPFCHQSRFDTQKVVEILTPLITSFSEPGATVLDPFMGSVTTGFAAGKAGWHFVGIELAQGHFEKASRRLGIAGKSRKAA